MLLADLYLMTGRARESIYIYRRLIQQDGTHFSVTAFTNLAWALETDGRPEEALDILREGTAVFPDDYRLVFEMAKYLFQLGEDVEARGLILDFLKNHPGNQRMALGLLRMEWTSLRPERFLSEIWRTYIQDPGNESLCRYLVWYLLGLKDYRSAIIGLDLYNRGGEPAGGAWYYHYGGLLQALSGRYDQALELMNRSIKTGEAFDSLYNRAVLYRKIGNLNAAREDLWRAVFLADQSSQEPSIRSRIHTEIGQVLLSEGNRDGARRELLYAIDLEKGNERASFLLRELEK